MYSTMWGVIYVVGMLVGLPTVVWMYLAFVDYLWELLDRTWSKVVYYLFYSKKR